MSLVFINKDIFLLFLATKNILCCKYFLVKIYIVWYNKCSNYTFVDIIMGLLIDGFYHDCFFIWILKEDNRV